MCIIVYLYSNKNEVQIAMEVWKDVIGYEGIYAVSNFGNVKRIGNGSDGRKLNERYMTQKSSGWKGQYLSVNLTKNNVTKNQYVHRLVCIAFYGYLGNNFQVNHKDGNKHNNHLNNLEWVTPKENQEHKYTVLGQDQNGENNPANKYPEHKIRMVKKMFLIGNKTQRQIARELDIDYRYVNAIVKGKVWTHI